MLSVSIATSVWCVALYVCGGEGERRIARFPLSPSVRFSVGGVRPVGRGVRSAIFYGKPALSFIFSKPNMTGKVKKKNASPARETIGGERKACVKMRLTTHTDEPRASLTDSVCTGTSRPSPRLKRRFVRAHSSVAFSFLDFSRGWGRG